ncbi:hypothetical protein ANCDUO_19974 [Ancylostoma duodenale]|uniref:Uncharacterized protein n=1 Tax=Ancylostoma duodenale TaxID=51022 RepID=A0A0C2FN13_9BILA|nr:hypothetical protein ANCDUO_19974 [Ancylostoma duodenale]
MYGSQKKSMTEICSFKFTFIVINDDRRFAVTLDVSQFHPDEVKVIREDVAVA